MQDSKSIYARWCSNMYFMGMGSIQGFGRNRTVMGREDKSGWERLQQEPASLVATCVCFSFLPQLELSSSSEQMTSFDFIIYFKICLGKI